MFGFQRVGDLIWAHADARGKGFLVGCTAGRTTLAGEGLQHQDGHSHLLASTVPTVRAYDPAYAYELAVIVEDGIRRMYGGREPAFYYLTAMNEAYPQPAMPDGAEVGIVKGLYKVRAAPDPTIGPRVHLFGSGAILREVLRAQVLLASAGVAADVWSVTSYSELRRDALSAERWNTLHPSEPPITSWLGRALADEPWPIVAASDYLRAVPDQIARFVPAGFRSLGTDGFGRSETREGLRRFFEVDAEHVAVTALAELVQRGSFDARRLDETITAFEITTDGPDPWTQ
jgi:pyruvate dehydrogenase E1 component